MRNGKNDGMEIRLLGPLEVETTNGMAALGGPKQRAVLAALALDAGRTVTVDSLIDTVWGDEAHDRAANTLQVYVSNLRKALEPGRADGSLAPMLFRRTNGYVLDVEPNCVDALRAESLIATARVALSNGDPAEADRLLTEALGLWRGAPLLDVSAERLARFDAPRLDELEAGALEDRIEARLQLGQCSSLLPELEDLIRRYPYRERLRGQLMLSLYRAERQVDALAAYREARETLLEEVGIDPGRELRDLERRILQQDPSLDYISGGRDTPDAEFVSEDEAATLRVAAGTVIGVAYLRTPGGDEIMLTGEPCTIGRHRDNLLAIHDTDVSRRHAVIRLRGQVFVLIDLGSTNGTMLNGEPVTEHHLTPGDVIRIGETDLTFDTLSESATQAGDRTS